MDTIEIELFRPIARFCLNPTGLQIPGFLGKMQGNEFRDLKQGVGVSPSSSGMAAGQLDAAVKPGGHDVGLDNLPLRSYPLTTTYDLCVP